MSDMFKKTEAFSGFAVDDIQAAKRIYRGEGPYIAWFKDAAGNILSVLQKK